MESHIKAAQEEWSKYGRLKIIVALILLALLILLWILGYGPGGSKCAACNAPAAVAAAAPVVATAAAPVAAAAAPAASCNVTLEAKAGKVNIAGAAKDDAAKKSIVDGALAAFGAGNVTDGLRVDAGAGACAWATKANDFFAWMKPKGDIGAVVNGNEVTLNGLVASQGIKDDAGSWAQTYFGAGTKINNLLQIAAPAVAANKPPALNVYFDTGKFAVNVADRNAMKQIIDYAKANPSAKVTVSGFHDARGNKVANEELAKNRAKAVREILRYGQVADEAIVMKKPVETTGSGSLKEARRVEVAIE